MSVTRSAPSSATSSATRSRFHVEGMDCAAEESLVRARLEAVPAVRSIQVDLERREVHVVHEGGAAAVENALAELRLGSRPLGSEAVEGVGQERVSQRGVLRAALAINGVFFLLEAIFGVLARSLGLVADSVDMLADALVYASSLAVVGGAIATQKRIARWSGYGQLTLAGLGFVEVLRRALAPTRPPEDVTMVVVATLALGANVATLALLRRARSGQAHMRASVIFTSNDVILNLGVIAAGVLVAWTGSALPDLMVGALVFAVVARGAVKILSLAG